MEKKRILVEDLTNEDNVPHTHTQWKLVRDKKRKKKLTQIDGD